MNHQSDFGYATGAVSMTCAACGSYADGFCCDGSGDRLTYPAWKACVQREVLRIEGVHVAVAPWSAMYAEGLSVSKAVDRVLS